LVLNNSKLLTGLNLTSSFYVVNFCLFLCSKLDRFRSYIWILINLFRWLHCTVTWLSCVYWFILLHCSVKSTKIQFIKLTCIFRKDKIVLKKILKSNSSPLLYFSRNNFLQIGCDQNNTSSSSSIVHPISVGTFKNKSWRKTNMKGSKTVWVPKEKILPLADILHPNKKSQILELGKRILTVH